MYVNMLMEENAQVEHTPLCGSAILSMVM